MRALILATALACAPATALGADFSNLKWRGNVGLGTPTDLAGMCVIAAVVNGKGQPLSAAYVADWCVKAALYVFSKTAPQPQTEPEGE